ncbi:hypothetical protein [Asanoa iriomotensis]|uniref:hypothetical protein n=1 Tax=Asanoa iriomotensis TaxID=234613 RepID=UPI001944445D|nr:hypothetical protein [Asanoa iriomotensis]
MTSVHEARVAEVDRHLTGAEHAAVERHAALGDAIRHSFARLRDGLDHAHAGCDKVDDRAWADYVASVDRGLDEMAIEVTRATESPNSGATAPEVLTGHASALELSGWRLRFTLPELSTAEAELDRYRSASAAGDRPSADPLHDSVDQLRAAGQRRT